MRKPLQNQPNARGNAIRQIFTETDKRTIYIPAPQTSRKSSSSSSSSRRRIASLATSPSSSLIIARICTYFLGLARIECIAIRFEILSHCDYSLFRVAPVRRILETFHVSLHSLDSCQGFVTGFRLRGILSCGLLEKTTSRLSTMNTKHQTGCILANTIAIYTYAQRFSRNLDIFFFFCISQNYNNVYKFFTIKIFVINKKLLTLIIKLNFENIIIMR